MNVDLTHRILAALGKPTSLIKPVADRPGHDRRYCLDTAKLRAIGWPPQVPFEDGLRGTIDWYRRNEWWWRPIKETGSRVPVVLPGAVRHAAELMHRRSRHRRGRLRRQPSARAVAQVRLPISSPGPVCTSAAARGLARWSTVDLLDRDRVRAGDRGAAAVPRLSLRRRRACRRVVARHAAAARGERAGDASPASTRSAAPASRCRVLVPGSAHVYAPSDRGRSPRTAPLAPASPYAISKLAQEQLALRAIR